MTLPSTPGDAIQLRLADPFDGDAADQLRVFVGPPEACCAGKVAIAGTYSVDNGTISFVPAFDFIQGQAYTVQTQNTPAGLSSFTIAPDQVAATPEVLAVYPSGPEIPENTLRFYIQFSTPMMPHRAAEFISLVDADGNADTAAFMSFTQELWNENRSRLTLLMDPGRIKRGVAQNTELGPALVAGNRYAIVVDEGWPSAISGLATARSEFPFIVSDALRDLPDVDLWQLQTPKPGSTDALIISFDRPFDQQLAQSAIAVHQADGPRIAGEVTVENNGQLWRFQPDTAWTDPEVQIVVDARFEDVAGNNFRDRLDHEVGTDTQTLDREAVILDVLLKP